MGDYGLGMNAARLEFLSKDKKTIRKPEYDERPERVDRAPKPKKCFGSTEAAGPRKVKFVLFLNNAAIINENAVAADENEPQ